MEFGKKLRTILEFEGLQQKEFADMINVHPSTLNGYINEGKQPDFELVKTMASALGVSTDYLLDYEYVSQEPPLSNQELVMLTKFRKLSKEKQVTLTSLIDMLSEK